MRLKPRDLAADRRRHRRRIGESGCDDDGLAWEWELPLRHVEAGLGLLSNGPIPHVADDSDDGPERARIDVRIAERERRVQRIPALQVTPGELAVDNRDRCGVLAVVGAEIAAAHEGNAHRVEKPGRDEALARAQWPRRIE